MTPELLARLAELDLAATPVPWLVRPGHDEEDHDHVDTVDGSPIAVVDIGEHDQDAALIAETRNALPALLAEVDALAARVAEAEEALRREVNPTDAEIASSNSREKERRSGANHDSERRESS